jgi:hypothetical protein
MPLSSIEIPVALDELDRVRLNKAVQTEGRTLASGLTGTVLLCYGTKAYEVEFDGIHDFFEVKAEDLELP